MGERLDVGCSLQQRNQQALQLANRAVPPGGIMQVLARAPP